MAREPINWEVEKEDVKEFIQPLNIELNINKNLYRYLFTNKMDESLKKLEKEIVNRLFKENNYEKYKKALTSKISLSYTPDFKNKNWILRYSPVQILNTIFELVGMNLRFDYIDYDDEKEVNKIRYKAKYELTDKYETLVGDKANEGLIDFVDYARSSIDKILLLKDYDIESSIDKVTNYKNLLLYLASKSLDIYVGTENYVFNQELDIEDNASIKYKGNINYYAIPKQYYNEVSGKKRAKMPHTLRDSFEKEDINYESFNKRYIKTLRDDSTLVDDSLDLNTINVMDRLEAVTSDCFKKDTGIIYDAALIAKNKGIIKSKNNKTPEQIMDMLEEKIKFYHNLVYMKDNEEQNEVVGVFRGKIDLYGYYGFILKNNYVVLDSFFKLNSDNQIVPSTEEAVYILPIDLFVQLKGIKSKMMEYKKEHEDGNLDRRYHTDKLSFKNRIMEAIEKEDVSTMKANWFLPIYAPSEEHIKR